MNDTNFLIKNGVDINKSLEIFGDINTYNQTVGELVVSAKDKLAKFKNQVSSEMGVPFTDYNGDLTSKQCGSVGGEMVKRMVEQYENGMK